MIKTGTILNNYVYQVGSEEIIIDSDIVNGNPDIFSPVDWKQELHSYIKTNKFPQPKTLAAKLEPFIEEMILSSIGSNNGVQVDEERLAETTTSTARHAISISDNGGDGSITYNATTGVLTYTGAALYLFVLPLKNKAKDPNYY